MECYVNLREKGTAINIHLTETWWRHYQVSLSDDEYYQSSLYGVLVYLLFLRFPLLCLYIHLQSQGGKGAASTLRTGFVSILHPHSPVGYFTLLQFYLGPRGRGQTLLVGDGSQVTL